MRNLRQTAAIAVVATSTLVACGSTAPLESTAAEGGTAVSLADNGLGLGPATAAGPGASSSAAARDADAPTSGGPGAVAAPSANPGNTGDSGTPGAVDARGVTPDSIAIGIGWIDVSKLASTFAPSFDSGSASAEEQIQAIVDWMNRRGGIAGRQIVPHYHEFPVGEILDESAVQRREQATCDDFTQDRPSFAAIPVISASGIFNDCAAQRGLVTVEVTNVGENVDSERFADLASVWWRPNWITGERREAVVVSQLRRRGFFDAPDVKVGMLVEDSPVGRRMGEVLEATMSSEAGVKVAETVAYAPLDDGSAAVLRFRSSGVTHVVWAGCSCGGIPQANFMRTAESQGYRPTYALSTDLAILNITNLGAPPAQLANTVAIGWNTDFDGVQQAAQPPTDAPISPSAADCRQAAAEADIPYPYGMYCEGLFFLKRAIEAAPSISPEGVRAAVEQFGSSYVAVTAFATAFGPTRHDGVAAVRDLHYDEACSCWSYRGDVQPV